MNAAHNQSVTIDALSDIMTAVIVESLHSVLAPGSLGQSDGDRDDVKRDDNDTKHDDHKDANDNDVTVSADGIMARLNIIRSGRSLRDRDVHARMVEYFDALDDAEKLALHTFLEGIAEILTGDTSGDDAHEPHDVDVTMKAKHVNVKPHKKHDANKDSFKKKNANDNARQQTQHDHAIRDRDANAEPRSRALQAREDTTPPIRVQR